MGLSASQPDNRFSGKVPLELYSRGMGAIGLPGDLSSTSRFARAAFVKLNSIAGESENECVNQFFHIMDTIIQPRGCCEVKTENMKFPYIQAAVTLQRESTIIKHTTTAE